MYLKLKDYCKPYLRREYEDLRREYEDLRRPFNNKLNLGDVFRFPNFETDTNKHDTIKPEKLTRVLIQTCSKKGCLKSKKLCLRRCSFVTSSRTRTIAKNRRSWS